MFLKGVTILTAVLTAWVTMGVTIVSTKPEIGNRALTFVGTVEGKSYFLEKANYNWTRAKQRCEGSGMRLATITTPTQLAFLKSSYSVTSSYYYWTGGRDSQTVSQFVWDHNNASLSSSVITSYKPVVDIQTCVLYRALSTTVAGFFFEVCQKADIFCLCEINHNGNI